MFCRICNEHAEASSAPPEVEGFDLDRAVIIHLECLLLAVQTLTRTLILVDPNIRIC